MDIPSVRGTSGRPVAGAQAAYRLLDVLEELALHTGRANLTSIAATVGFSLSTAKRLLSVLVSRGYVEFDPESRTYRAGPAMHLLGMVRPDRASLRLLARPILADLQASTGETVFLSLRDGVQLVYLDVLRPDDAVPMRGRPGVRLPLHATAQGKLTLACLPRAVYDRVIGRERLTALTSNTITDVVELRKEVDRVKKEGVALSLQESERAICSIAAPIADPLGNLVGSVCVGGPASRMSPETMSGTIKPALLKARDALAVLLCPRVDLHHRPRTR